MTLRAFNEMFPNEDAAHAWFEKSRWPHGPECPKCGSIDRSSWLKKPRRWHCIACHHQFSVTAGTPMHRTHLPLLAWAHAIYLIVSSPNWCASSASAGCSAPDPVGGVPPPPRDCTTHTSVRKRAARPGYQVRPKRHIWCLLRQLDSSQGSHMTEPASIEIFYRVTDITSCLAD